MSSTAQPDAALPEGWSERSVGEVVPFSYGKALPAKRRTEGRVGVYSSAGLIGSHDEALVEQRAVVVGRKGAAGNVLSTGGPAWVIDTAYFAVPPDSLRLEYLAFALSAAQLQRLDQSTAVPSLSRDDLHNVTLRLPPLSEQDRLVELIRRAIERIERATQALDRGLQLSRALRLSLLNRLRPSEAPMVKVKDVGDVFVGATPSRKNPENWEGDVPWVSSGEVAFCRIRETNEHISRAAMGNAARRLHPPGTVLLAMYGEGRTRGQAAVLDIEAATNQAVAAVRLDESAMLPDYLYLWLVRQYAALRQIGHGGQQVNLNKDLVSAIEVPCPPLTAQRALVARIAGALSQLDVFEARLRVGATQADVLRRAVMYRATMGLLRGRRQP